MRTALVVPSLAAVALATGSARADDDAPVPDAPRGDAPRVDGPPASPTSTTLDRADLDRRPHQATTDLLRHVPGLVALGQGGRADQLLVRGTDGNQDHTIHVVVDGVPIDLGSHAFLHGYADTHFLIADSVARVALYEGGYAARYGSSSIAGTLELTTLDRVPGGVAVRLASGTELTDQLLPGRLRRLRYNLVGMFSPELTKGSALLATEVGIDDGPYVHPQRFRRGLVLGKWTRPVGEDGTLATMIQFYSGRWFDSGHLPLAALDAGRLTPFSAADPTQGGIALRSSASVTYEVTDARRATWHLGVYAVDSDLRLYTNPTLFRDDAVHGDQIEYVDARLYYGLDAYWRRPYARGPITGLLRLGVQARADHAQATTWHDQRRLRLEDCGLAINPCTDTAPQTRVVSAYAEDTTDWKRLRVQPGIRLDEESWNVDDRDADTMLGATTLGGTGARARISPRLAITYRGDALDVFAAGNFGSLATDARAAVERTGFGSFTRTRGAEVGVRAHPAAELAGAFAAWIAEIDGHQVWLPAAGRGELVPQATRRGLEASLVFAPSPHVICDASLAIARGQETRTGDVVAFAPRASGTGGITLAAGPHHAGLRIRGLGPRATPDPRRIAEGWTVVDAVAGTRWRAFELTLTVNNVFDERWRESQLLSDVRVSRTVDVTRDLLVAVGTPLTVWVSVGYVPR